MAQFAAANSGYSDPLKAYSIKALEQRQRDTQAQIAAHQDDAASMATIPGGIGHVLGVIGDSMQQNRIDQATAAQRDMFAKTIAGMDPNNPKPQDLANIATADPESFRQLVTQMAEARRQQALFAQQDQSKQQEFTHTDAAAAQKVLDDQAAAREAARVAEEGKKAEYAHSDQTKQQEFTHTDAAAAQKVLTDQEAARTAAATAQTAAEAQETRVRERPSTEGLPGLKREYAAGRLTKDEYDAAAKKYLAPAANEQGIINKESEAAIEHQSTLNALDEATALLNSPKGVQTGNWAGATQTIGEHVPGFLQGNSMLPDPDVTKNTQRYNQIMDAEAMNLVVKMKGSSSDKDVDRNYKIASNPNATKDARIQAIGVLKEKYSAYLAQNQRAIDMAGGDKVVLPKRVFGGATTDAPAPTGAGGTGPATAPAGGDDYAAAKAWLADHPNDPRAEAVRKRLGGG